ncbi:MAG: 2TM domain-containing protein [Lutibacter sp.]|uniref:2TM domain-containing protein n=1 Tax=Lutibacter sp. TaxID=1925666 RepID=UPI00385E83CD
MKEQHELYENARNRIKQKKQLYFHFVLFLIGSVFLIILNKLLKVGENYIENWFVWVVIVWLFILILHFVNVFITHRFMGKDWERKQTEKLVIKQKLKIAKLESEHYASELKKKENSQDNLTKE